jgi:2-polyprenyl-6-hydroxyphenyl methylase/3-demethylubiquinone-9 3-methyltransferase
MKSDATDLKDVSNHFQFGANWKDYLQHVDEAAIFEAEKGLSRLVPTESLAGARFMDIGCGSGLHTLAALRLGAAEVVAIDIDPDSVSATQELLSRFPDKGCAKVLKLSIFDAEVNELGQFDVIYSWGVLHHTGDMWTAIERAGRFVKPGGIFALALYQKRPTCAAWAIEKKFYSRSGSFIQRVIRCIYKPAFLTALLLNSTNPFSYVKNYKGSRGMNFHNDVHDWLGGYPYESATPEEVGVHLGGMGFKLVHEKTLSPGRGTFGTGCAEYVFSKDSL